MQAKPFAIIRPIRLMMLAGLVVVMMLLVMPAGAQEAATPASAEPAATVVDSTSRKKVKKTTHMSLLQLLLKGRWFMVPIGACSLLGLAIIFERGLALRYGKVIPRRFMTELKQALQNVSEERESALSFCHENDCPIARVAAAGIRKLDRDESSIEQAIEDAGANEVAKLRRNLRMLYGVAAVAPMLGLLGTVWGMIEAFQVASAKGLGQAELLATGIYEALVTTFAGLCVAIPVLVAYYYFLGKIEHIVSRMNDLSVDFVEQYTRRTPDRRPERTELSGRHAYQD